MLQSIWEDVKREFSYGNMVTQLIIVNVAVFVLMGLTSVVLFLAGSQGSFDELQHLFSISNDFIYNLTHPWVILTHMFLHANFFHILFNMLILYWFGKILGDFLGNQRILPLYLLGGLAGALAYFTFAQFSSPPNVEIGYALGASAAVSAIVVAAGVTAPNYYMNLLLVGPVKLKYIVAVIVLIDVFSVAQVNAQGSVAHLGGAAFGWLFVTLLRQGNDLSVPTNAFIDSVTNFFKSLFAEREKKPPRAKKKPHVAYKNTARKATQKRATNNKAKSADKKKGDLSHQDKVDAILDKIKKSGYESLSTEEKEFLFKASKQN